MIFGDGGFKGGGNSRLKADDTRQNDADSRANPDDTPRMPPDTPPST